MTKTLNGLIRKNIGQLMISWKSFMTMYNVYKKLSISATLPASIKLLTKTPLGDYKGIEETDGFKIILVD